MNIVNKLTLRHMKLNKRRTFVTVIGIIISVAMITAVSTVMYSIMDYMARNAMVTEGHFHFKFMNYYYEDNEKILDEFDVEDYSIIKVLGDYVYEESEDSEESGIQSVVKFKPYSYTYKNQQNEENTDFVDATRIIAVDDNYYDMMEIELESGHYPANDSEILVSENMSYALEGMDVGDSLVIGNKEYTIAGFIKNVEFESKDLTLPYAMTYPLYTKLDTDTLEAGDLVSGFFYAGGVIEGLESSAEELREKLQASGVPEDEIIENDFSESDGTWYSEGTQISYNYRVLMYLGLSQYGNINAIINTFKIILIVVIMIGSVSLIANGFIISISERSRYLGMLASVGATKKQKRSSVYFEGFLEGIIAIPLGILAGIGGIAITFECISPLIRELSGTDTELRVIVNSSVIIWTVVFSVLTIFLSAYFPAKRASKISPVDAIRQNKDVKIGANVVKTMGITRKVFGFEGDLALKNLKRNKKRYRVTVFSMFVSLTLFISVYSLVYFTKQGMYSEMKDIGYDMYISKDEFTPDILGFEASEEVGEEFKKLTDEVLKMAEEYIDSAQRYKTVHFSSYYQEIDSDTIDKELYTKEYYEYLDMCYGFDMIPSIMVLAMSEDDLKDYLDELDIEYDDFVSDTNNIILFDGIRETSYTDNGRYVFEGNVFKDDIEKFSQSYTILREELVDDGMGNMESVSTEVGTVNEDYNIYAKADKFPGLSRYRAYMLITPQKLEELSGYGVEISHCVGMDVNNDKKVEEIFYQVAENRGYDKDSYYYENYTEQVKNVNNSMLLMSVFVYGFIILMSLICVANIVNTISTSLSLRRKEFAMLKSVGMTDRAFNKMIAYESGFYGIKALIFGLPVGTLIMFIIRDSMTGSFMTDFGIPWMGYLIAIVGVFAVIGLTMLYSSGKIKKANVIEALRNENI